jgi:hypothetical protein
VARYGGAEFVLLLPETGKPGALTKAGAHPRRHLRASRCRSRHVCRSRSASRACPTTPRDAESLLTATEAAIRGAKRGGGGRMHYFSSAGTRADARSSRRSFLRIREPEIDRFRPYHERMNEVTGILRAIARCLPVVDLSPACERVEHRARRRAPQRDLRPRRRGARRLRGRSCARRSDLPHRRRRRLPRAAVAARRQIRSISSAWRRQRRRGAVEPRRWRRRCASCCASSRGSTSARRACCQLDAAPERLVARLVTEANAAARLARERSAQRDKAMLQDIILGDGLVPVYQPIVDLGTGDIFGYEALTRGPKRHALESPATLFAVADEVDLTFELDRACFRGALRNAVGLEPVHRLFVNLLPMSFYDASVHRDRGRPPPGRRHPDPGQHRLRDHRAPRDRELRGVPPGPRRSTPRWASASRSTTSARATPTSRR